MNDLSENKYFKTCLFDVDDYSLNDFLYNEIAVERRTDFDSVMLAVSGLLAMSGFNVHMRGTHYVAKLVAERAVSIEFSQDEAIARIARDDEIEALCVIAEIETAVGQNKRFYTVMSRLLGKRLENTVDKSISDMIDIAVAAFKIHYNYVTDNKYTVI